MSIEPTKIGAYDAKVRLSALLDRVERGEEIIITRHNRPIARLIPEGQGQNVATARAAIAALTTLRAELAAKDVRLSPTEIRALRDDSRT
ncbi:MAG: type II toxin-antitoxin system prevent-host-death family antitoxin [Acetobacteraceae bacterium]|nr:type II toxin-antitoxin system prevent-host-death family antitoxin [Acetobacteraceae bacterium]